MESMIKRRRTDTKIKIQTAVMTALVFALLTGCSSASEEMMAADGAKSILTELPAEGEAEPVTEKPVKTVNPEAISTPEKEETSPPNGEGAFPSEEETDFFPEEELGSPRSSYGLGSASFLEGRNILVSLFVTTPESGWTDREQEKTLAKLGIAVNYIEEQARQYGVSTEVVYDWSSQHSLKAETETDFSISEDADFVDRLDEEIARWFEDKISYEKLLETYEAEGIATCVFVNNPGVSYAIVYDGTDNTKESLILFTGDYYNPGKAETASAYAHEILHVFGAHDLYEGAEFTEEVTDYVADTYPNEIMFTVSGTGNGRITQMVSPITAYHLGWISYAEEIDRFPQLIRD